MAQAQLVFTEETLSYLKDYGLTSVQWSPISKQITCQLDDQYTLIVKTKRNKSFVCLRKGASSIRLNISQFLSLCNLKESILLLSAFLEGQV